MTNRDEEILELKEMQKGASASEVAGHLGISRQAAHRRLRSLVDKGVLLRKGSGPTTHYCLTEQTRCFVYQRVGLEEDHVWNDLRQQVEELGMLEGEVKHVFSYALTELVNNAIDHSESPSVEVRVRIAHNKIAFEVIDCGVGIFERLRVGLNVPDDLSALQELSKGKATTQPEKHTGEGIFFTSKAADRFEIESGRILWIVDNQRGDVGVGEVKQRRQGTRVVFEANPGKSRNLRKIFDEYSQESAFTRTRTVVKLFAIGVEFVSRSEAKRLVCNLDKFKEVILDFGGVEMVGQGFADEVFRVWRKAHPDVRLIPTNMNDPVAFMVERAQG